MANLCTPDWSLCTKRVMPLQLLTIYGPSMLAVTFSVFPLPQNCHMASVNGCGCAISVSIQSDQFGRYNGALI